MVFMIDSTQLPTGDRRMHTKRPAFPSNPLIRRLIRLQTIPRRKNYSLQTRNLHRNFLIPSRITLAPPM